VAVEVALIRLTLLALPEDQVAAVHRLVARLAVLEQRIKVTLVVLERQAVTFRAVAAVVLAR
jgi:hypothetical protein